MDNWEDLIRGNLGSGDFMLISLSGWRVTGMRDGSGRQFFKGYAEWEALWPEIFSNGGVKGVGHFFLKIVATEQAFVFLIGNVSHLHQYGGDIRSF